MKRLFTLLALLTAIGLVAPVSADPLPPLPTGGDLRYVALGDSYTAGPLIPITYGNPPGCVRSTRNYPAELAERIEVGEFVDVSCSAADTSNMTQPQDVTVGTNPPQFQALTADTDLVTLGIGGNDFGLFGSMISTCPGLREQNPTGAPCRRHFTVDGVDTKLRDARRIQANVADVVRGIHRRAPEATVLVVGYLRIAPARGTCPEVLPFADGDYRWADRVERRLNTSLENAAENNQATFVDMYPPSRGHDACAGKAAWVNGAQTKPHRAYEYHPFAEGMAGIAEAVYQTLQRR